MHESIRTWVARRQIMGMAIILMLSPVRAWPWGCEGHQTIAIIAEKHMTPHALEMANRLLHSEPIDPALSRFCASRGLDLLADSSNWADDLKSARPETSVWHYIDIPRGAPQSALAASCPASSGCVTSAIEHQIHLLRSHQTDTRERADALRFIIHLVGDLHQPLHCVSNNDEGGNCVPVDFFGNVPVEKNLQYETYSPNLHSIWDSAILQRIEGAETVTQWAARLDQRFGSEARQWDKEGINIENWAWESHVRAESVAYGKLTVPIPVEKPEPIKSCGDDNHVSARMLKLHEQVSQSYVDAVAPSVNEQITKAGVRLAMILNLIWR